MYVGDYQFRYGTTGLVLNGNNNFPTVGNPVWDIYDVAGMDLPDVQVSSRNHDGYDGGAVEATFLGMRTIVLKGTLMCHKDDSLEYWLDRLKRNYQPSSYEEAILYPTTERPFFAKAPGTVERQITARSLGVKYPWDTSRRYSSTAFQIMLMAETPVWESLVPKVLGPVAVNQTLTYDNQGSYATGPLITISGACVNPSISLSSQPFPITGTMGVGDFLQIDFESRTLTYIPSGGAPHQNWRNKVVNEGSWFRCRPGTSELTLHVTSGTPTMTLNVTDQWL